MNGGHLGNFRQSFRIRAVFGMIFNGIVIAGISFVAIKVLNLELAFAISLILGLSIIVSLVTSYVLSKILIKPTEYLAQAIFHVSPNEHFVSAPNVEELGFGKDLVSNLTRQIYDYASINKTAVSEQQPQATNNILDQIPVGIIGLDIEGNIKLINKTASDVFGLSNPIGLPLESQLQILFITQKISDWISESKEKSINSNNMWRKVDISSSNGQKRSYYDIAGIYRQGHSSGVEVLLAFFNHDQTFRVEDDALNLIALSVHEIRTPLTILRGYVDVLREELDGKLDEQTQTYFDRLDTSSQNLSTFMSNVLNVVRADQNQLSLALNEEDWSKNLTQIVNGIKERATIRDKEIILKIDDNLPKVALDKVSISEVLTNLLDNAIKYSPATSKNIWITAKIDTDGTILTTVQDQGVGIPDSVIPNLFTKFHRNHRNKNSVAGTGLGLFLSKAIVLAHHGNIWIKSKEGQGTTVGFTLLPYDRLAELIKDEDNGLQKVTHGWIKNHGMQRR